MQARIILAHIPGSHLRDALRIAALVVASVILVRLVVVVGFNRLVAWRHRRRGHKEPASVRQAILVGWSGMRGLVTLATAFALPSSFPHRDEVVLVAFAVVLATLVCQGATLGPLIRRLGLDEARGLERELGDARAGLAAAGLHRLQNEAGPEAEMLRAGYRVRHEAASDPSRSGPFRRTRALGLAAIAAERERLEALRAEHLLSQQAFGMLQEELDWRMLTLLPDEQRQIEEG